MKKQKYLFFILLIFLLGSCTNNFKEKQKNFPLSEFILGKWEPSLQNKLLSKDGFFYIMELEFIDNDRLTLSEGSFLKGYSLNEYKYTFINQNLIHVDSGRFIDEWRIVRNDDKLLVSFGDDENFLTLERKNFVNWRIIVFLLGIIILIVGFVRFNKISEKNQNGFKKNTNNLPTQDLKLLPLILKNFVLILIALGIGFYFSTNIGYFLPKVLIRNPWRELLWIEICVLIVVLVHKFNLFQGWKRFGTQLEVKLLLGISLAVFSLVGITLSIFSLLVWINYG